MSMGCSARGWVQGSNDEEMDRYVVPTRGGTQFQFDAKFFRWWDRQIVVVDDYVYHGVDYHDDPDMVLPEGERFNMSLVRKINLQYFWYF
jgi:hypothetical protein